MNLVWVHVLRNPFHANAHLFFLTFIQEKKERAAQKSRIKNLKDNKAPCHYHTLHISKKKI